MTDMGKINTEMAIEAFRKLEQKEFQLELAKHELSKALKRGSLDMEYYFAETEKVRAKCEDDRVVAARQGRLPRETS